MMASEKLFGMHATALQLRSQRMMMLASNIANAATPNYKARDLDFSKALDLARQGGFRKTEEWLVALGALGRGGTGPGSLAGADGGGGFSRRVVPGEYPRHHYLSGDAHPSHRVVAGPPAHHHPYAGMPFPGGVLPGYPHPVSYTHLTLPTILLV